MPLQLKRHFFNFEVIYARFYATGIDEFNMLTHYDG